MTVGTPAAVAATFDALAEAYDTLGFVRACAGRLAARADLQPGERVLDVAAGTGLLTLAIARAVGPTGRVVGVDLSPGMLAVARAKLERQRAAGRAAGTPGRLAAVELRVADAARPDVADGSMDAVLCASSLFFLPDMTAAVRAWTRATRPGGRVGFSAFGPAFLQPLGGLWAECLRRHDVAPEAPPTRRLADADTCRALLAGADLADVRVDVEPLDYELTPEGRWAEIVAGLEGRPLAGLPAARRERLRSEHLEELRAAAAREGARGTVRVALPGVFAFGTRR